jgi:PmbA protein
MTMKNILDKAKEKADSVEVFSSREKAMSVSYENNVIKDSNSSDLGGTSVRVIKDGKIGTSSSGEPGDESIADFAVDLAQYGKAIKYRFAPKTDIKPFKVTTVEFDKATEDYAIGECEKVINELKGVHPDALASCTFSKTSAEMRVLNSNGVDITQKENSFSWFCGLNYNTEGNFLQVYDFKYDREYTGFEKLVENVKEDFQLCMNPDNIEPGKYKVLFTPRGMMHLLMVWTACLSGLAVVKGISPWKDKLGDKLFDSKVSVFSDLTSDDASNRFAYDDEGTPTGNRHLIDKGVLKSFFHSRDTAAQLNQEPTGHGFRYGFSSNPGPTPMGIEFTPGLSNIDEMLKQADILVDDLIGSVMSNPYSGIITGTTSLVYRIENGKKSAQIKNAMVSVNVFEQFKNNIISVSKDVEKLGLPPFFPTFKSPAFLIGEVSISAK